MNLPDKASAKELKKVIAVQNELIRRPVEALL